MYIFINVHFIGIQLYHVFVSLVCVVLLQYVYQYSAHIENLFVLITKKLRLKHVFNREVSLTYVFHFGRSLPTDLSKCIEGWLEWIVYGVIGTLIHTRLVWSISFILLWSEKYWRNIGCFGRNCNAFALSKTRCDRTYQNNPVLSLIKPHVFYTRRKGFFSTSRWCKLILYIPGVGGWKGGPNKVGVKNWPMRIDRDGA